MNAVGLVIVAALLIESIVNIIVNVQDKETSWKYWASLVFGLGISILVAFNWDLDLFRLVGLSEPRIPFVGAILTGLILSRGSNVISDLIGLIKLPQ